MDRHYINDPEKTDEQLTSARDAWLNKYVKRYKPEPFKYKDPIKTTEVPKNIPGTTLGNLLGQTTPNVATPGYTPVNILGNNRPLSNASNNRYGNVNTMPSSGPGYASAMPSSGPGYASAMPSSGPGYSSVIPPTTIPPTIQDFSTYGYASKPFLPNNIRTLTIDPQQPFKLPTITDDDGVTIETVPYETQIQKDNDEMISNMFSSKAAVNNAENDIKNLDKIYEQYMDGVKIHEKSIANQDIAPDLKNFQEKYGTTDTQGAIRQAEESFKKVADTIGIFNDTPQTENLDNVTMATLNSDINLLNFDMLYALSESFNDLSERFVNATVNIQDYITSPSFNSSDYINDEYVKMGKEFAGDVGSVAYHTPGFIYNRYFVKEKKPKTPPKEKTPEDEIFDTINQRLDDLHWEQTAWKYHPARSLEYKFLKSLFNTVYNTARTVGSASYSTGSAAYDAASAIKNTTDPYVNSFGNAIVSGLESGRNYTGEAIATAAAVAALAAASAGSYVGSAALSATQLAYFKMIEYGTRLYNSIAEQFKLLKFNEDPETKAERIGRDIVRLKEVTAFLEATRIFTEERLNKKKDTILTTTGLQEEYPSKYADNTFNTRLSREMLANKEQTVAVLNQNFDELKSNIKYVAAALNKFTVPNSDPLGDRFIALVFASFMAFTNDRTFGSENTIGINDQSNGFTLGNQLQNFGTTGSTGLTNINIFDNQNFKNPLPGQDDNIFRENVTSFATMINFLNQVVGTIKSVLEYGDEGAGHQINLVLDAASQFVLLFNPDTFEYGKTGDPRKPNTVFGNPYKESGTRGMGIKKYNEEIAALKTGYGIKGIPLIKDKIQEMIGGLVKDLEPKYKTYEPIHKVIDHLSTLPKFKRGGLVRKETYGCGICKNKPGYGKRFLVHNKNNKDITCSNCFGDHGMTGGRITERDAEFNFIEDSKDPEHEEMVSNQKTNDYLDEIEKETPNTAFEDFDASANIDKRFVQRMGSDFVVNRPYDMRKNFESKDLDRLAYLVGMHEHAPEQMTTPLKVNMEALAINHLTKHNDPQATFPNPSKLQNFDSVKQELQNNPGFLKRFLQ